MTKVCWLKLQGEKKQWKKWMWICTTAQCFSHSLQLVQVLSCLDPKLQVLPSIPHQIPMAVEHPIPTWGRKNKKTSPN
jgi:hypothetical protein